MFNELNILFRINMFKILNTLFQINMFKILNILIRNTDFIAFSSGRSYFVGLDGC